MSNIKEYNQISKLRMIARRMYKIVLQIYMSKTAYNFENVYPLNSTTHKSTERKCVLYIQKQEISKNHSWRVCHLEGHFRNMF